MTTEAKLTENDFNETDREALSRAIQMTLEGHDREEAARIKSTLAEEGWWEAAWIAAHSQQCYTLNLSPWERPPCEFNDDDNPHDTHAGRPCDAASIKLLKRMVAHGLSKWESDPINALVNAKRK